MVKKKKFLVLLLTIALSFSVCFAFFGCADDEDKKYDVAIKVGCSDGSEVVFDTDVDEISITRSYDGNSYAYRIRAYRLPDHPKYGDTWFTPSGEGANVFSASMLYWDTDGTQAEIKDKTIKNKGKYIITIHADSTSDLWNFRTCYLNIIVN